MKRVLSVDDALELGRLLQTVFLTLDSSLTIQVVPSAEEALLESSRKSLDLLVSDIRLPGMSGFDLVKKIRARHPALKVIVITGLTDPGLADRSREMQVDGFFRKPLDMTAFIETAARCLELQRAVVSPAAAAPVVRQLPDPGSPSQAALLALISGLHQRLGALAVFVLDEQGQVLAHAGDAPALTPLEQWAAPTMALLTAGKKLSTLVGNAQNQQVMVFPGPQVQAALAPAANGALLIMLRPGPSSLRLALAVEEALEAQGALSSALVEPGAKKAPPAEEPAALPPTAPLEKHDELPPTAPLDLPPKPATSPAPEVSLDEFEKLLRKSEKELQNQDIDQFWDSLAASGTPGGNSNPDALSYEQAQKLGLAPKDEP